MFVSITVGTDTNSHIFFTILYLAESEILLINTDGLVIVIAYQTFYDVASHSLASFG